MTKEDAKKGTSVKLVGNIYKKIKEMSDYYGEPISYLVRTLINERYDNKYRIARVGHQVGTDSISRRSKKQTREETLANIEKMDDQSLTQFLLELGYLEPPALFNRSTGAWKREVMFTREDGNRWLKHEYYIPAKEDKSAETNTMIPEEITSSSETYSLNQVIQDLIKQKLI